MGWMTADDVYRVTVQWMFWGYSLAYSRNGGPFIGTLENFGLKNVMVAPSSGSAVLPEIVFCYFQLLFCACTVRIPSSQRADRHGSYVLIPLQVIIITGGAFERGNILPLLVFGFCWATVVYSPLARWTWSSKGWLYNLPALDYAGGGPVHIASGWSALAYALVLGKRKHGRPEGSREKPHNTTLVFVGTVMIWFGWMGFNVCPRSVLPRFLNAIKLTSQGGTTLNASMRAMVAIFNTNAAASTGILGWTLIDFIRHRGRFSVVGACEGAIAGLVGITPAAGFVTPWLAACIGFITALICSLLQDVNDWLHIDEGLDVFKLHGIGGMVGAFLTGIFATQSISALDGSTYQGGGLDGNGVQIGRQLAEVCAIAGYAFVVSGVLLYVINWIPGLRLRANEEIEVEGLDQTLLADEQIGDWSVFSPVSGVSASPSQTEVVNVK